MRPVAYRRPPTAGHLRTPRWERRGPPGHAPPFIIPARALGNMTGGMTRWRSAGLPVIRD